MAGLGAFFAAGVALLIALSDSARRRRERKARTRLVMASLYSPMVGILAMVMGIGKDAQIALMTLPGSAIRSVAENVESMKNGCDVMRPLLTVFDPKEAIYLSGDYGVALAAAIRDAELLEGLVTSVTEKYLPGVANHQNHAALYKLLQSLARVPSQAKAIEVRMSPFIEACARELGELKEGEKLRIS